MAGDYQALTRLYTDFTYLEARCEKQTVYDLQEGYRSALTHWKGDERDKILLSTFEERLRLEAHHIQRAQGLLFPQLYNHLTWLDAPDRPVHTICERYRQGRDRWLRIIQDPTPAPPAWTTLMAGHTLTVTSVAVTRGRAVRRLRVV